MKRVSLVALSLTGRWGCTIVVPQPLVPRPTTVSTTPRPSCPAPRTVSGLAFTASGQRAYLDADRRKLVLVPPGQC